MRAALPFRLFRHSLNFIVGLCSVVTAMNAAYAATCAECQPLLKKAAQLGEFRGRLVSVLQKNREFVAKLGDRSPSMKIKANSNIIVASLRIETTDNQLVALRRDMISKLCARCAGASR